MLLGAALELRGSSAGLRGSAPCQHREEPEDSDRGLPWPGARSSCINAWAQPRQSGGARAGEPHATWGSVARWGVLGAPVVGAWQGRAGGRPRVADAAERGRQTGGALKLAGISVAGVQGAEPHTCALRCNDRGPPASPEETGSYTAPMRRLLCGAALNKLQGETQGGRTRLRKGGRERGRERGKGEGEGGQGGRERLRAGKEGGRERGKRDVEGGRMNKDHHSSSFICF